MTAAGRPRKEPKWPVRLDGEIRAWVRELMERHPGTWASERAALHELLRVGRLTFTGPAPPPPPEPALPVQSGDLGAKPAPDMETCPKCGMAFPPGAIWDHKATCRGPASASPPPEAPAFAVPATGWDRPASSFGWTPPTVRCPRCGKDVETTAAAREAHFKECPPDPEPELDVAALVEELRARLRGEGPPAVPGKTPRDAQLEIVKDRARARGFELGDADAAEVLERALGPAGQVQSVREEHDDQGGQGEG